MTDYLAADETRGPGMGRALLYLAGLSVVTVAIWACFLVGAVTVITWLLERV